MRLNALASEDLLAALRALEVEMHRPEVRAQRARMDALLHVDFIEFGRSGTVWTREATLEEFAAPGAVVRGPAIHAEDFELRVIAGNLALLSYRSAHVDADGGKDRWTLRSSLWQCNSAGAWQLRFHQGTPTSAP